MVRHGLLAIRLAAGGVGAATLVAGTVFALNGGEGTSTAAPLSTVGLPSATYAAAVPSESPATPAAPEAVTAGAVAPTEPPATDVAGLAGTATVAPVRPVSQPPPETAAATSAPVASADLPIYKDTQVLAMAASVVLPSGKTFEQCVALGANGARWPVPVHLYYEGKGKWLVETHLGEIETEFDEATATFRVKHFAPEASECLR